LVAETEKAKLKLSLHHKGLTGRKNVVGNGLSRDEVLVSGGINPVSQPSSFGADHGQERRVVREIWVPLCWTHGSPRGPQVDPTLLLLLRDRSSGIPHCYRGGTVGIEFDGQNFSLKPRVSIN